jgi:hypothetical protein
MAASTTLAAPLLFYLTITKAGWGLDGAAVAFTICNAATLLGLVAFVVARVKRMEGDAKQTWSGFSKQAFSGWGEYLNYGERRCGYGEHGALHQGGCLKHAKHPKTRNHQHSSVDHHQPGVPAAAHICLEWWAMEIIILWAGE